MTTLAHDPCPPQAALSGYLAGTLDDASLSTLDAHLTACGACRAALDALTDNPSLRAWTDPLAGRAPSPFTPTPRPGLVGQLGRYDIEAELARGGMGVVYRGFDRELRRPVAVKVLRVGRDDPAAAARLRAEARAAAGLRHDHILPVYDVAETADGRPAVVMPLAPGGTLRQRLAAERTLPPAEAVRLCGQVAAALAAAHAAGVVHRDVKPSNVLLDGAGRPLLADFGLARLSADADRASTADGTALGTPEYAAPEQLLDAKHADHRADVYGLGATLYELLTGGPPFRGSPAELVARVPVEEPIPPRRLVPSVPRELDTVALKCLAKRPADRYPTAAALAADLRRWERGEPVLARPAGPVERSRKWVRRNPAAAVALLALGLLVGGLGAAVAVVDQARRRATAAEAVASDRLAAETRAKADAVEAADVRQAVTAFFLQDMLAADPAGGGRQAADVTVGDLLKRAGEQVGRKFPGKPHVEALVRAQIGAGHRNLADYPAAEPFARRAVELMAAAKGDDHPLTLDARQGLIALLHDTGRSPEAVPLAELSLAQAERRHGPDDPATRLPRHELAYALRLARKPDAARPLAEANAALYARIPAPPAERVAAEKLLGSVLGDLGRPAEAVAVLRTAYDRAVRELGDNHYLTADTANSLGINLGRAGDAAGALAMKRAAVAAAEAVYGPAHPDTLVVKHNLSIAVFDAGRHDEAIALNRECLAGFLKLHGDPDKRPVLSARRILATHLSLAGRPRLWPNCGRWPPARPARSPRSTRRPSTPWA